MSFPRYIGQYKIDKKLGTGGFSHVFLGSTAKSSEKFAIKTCQDQELLQKEYKILKHLSQIPDMIKIFNQGQYDDGAYFVLEPLGRSLAYEFNDKILSLECVCAIGFELLTILEKVHCFDVIHRDLKPSQFLISLDKKSIKLIDFGLATFYKNQGVHKEFKTRCKCRGTVSYASINNHLGFRQSRRDDLESLCYSIIYLVKGGLPWKLQSKVEGFRKWNLVLNQKINVNEKELFTNLPPEFLAFFKYVRNLLYDQNPNYDYLKSLLAKFINTDTLSLYFDWNSSSDKQKHSRKSQIVGGATIITRLRREKRINKKIKKQKSIYRKSCQLRFASTCGTIDRNKSEKSINPKRISFADETLDLNAGKKNKINFFNEFKEKKKKKHEPKKKSSCFLQLPTFDVIYCDEDGKRNKKAIRNKTGALTKVRSVVDLNENYLLDEESENNITDKKRSQEIGILCSGDGQETPRIPLPEFKDRSIVSQAKKFCISEPKQFKVQICLIS